MPAILYCYSNMGRHYINEYLTPSDSEGLKLMNIMPNFLKIVSVYVGALFFSSARMCGLYLIVIEICLYLYTEYGTSY